MRDIVFWIVEGAGLGISPGSGTGTIEGNGG